jgi:hypothetical protein
VLSEPPGQPSSLASCLTDETSAAPPASCLSGGPIVPTPAPPCLSFAHEARLLSSTDHPLRQNGLFATSASSPPVQQPCRAGSRGVGGPGLCGASGEILEGHRGHGERRGAATGADGGRSLSAVRHDNQLSQPSSAVGPAHRSQPSSSPPRAPTTDSLYPSRAQHGRRVLPAAS